MRKILSKDNFENFRSPFELRHIKTYESEKSYFIGHGKFAGTFYYDPSDVATADNFGIVLANAAGQRLKREIGVTLSNKWFGADDSWFANVADVNAKVPAIVRKKGMRALILESGSVNQYWYKSGVTDGDLVILDGVSTSLTPLPATFETVVLTSGGSINEGDTSVYIEDFEGLDIDFLRGRIEQSVLLGEYTWDSVTAILTFPAAIVDEYFKAKPKRK